MDSPPNWSQLFDPRTHRKLIRHFHEPGHAHELTFSCYQRLPLLNDPQRCIALSNSIQRAVAGNGFDLCAFVFMPEHVHLIIWPRTAAANVPKLLWAIKRPMSFRIRELMEQAGDPMLAQLTIRERPGKTVFRFWQEGGGYDRNIRSTNVVRTAAEYIHNNPVRRGLCATVDEWKWSSWKSYFRPEEGQDPELPVVHGFPE